MEGALPCVQEWPSVCKSPSGSRRPPEALMLPLWSFAAASATASHSPSGRAPSSEGRHDLQCTLPQVSFLRHGVYTGSRERRESNFPKNNDSINVTNYSSRKKMHLVSQGSLVPSSIRRRKKSGLHCASQRLVRNTLRPLKVKQQQPYERFRNLLCELECKAFLYLNTKCKQRKTFENKM